ncbi:MAG TPA: hypothetical protein VLG45_09860, partial [Thermodesulfobacteriota bacterium]|nr:hypothetical protein [Thermodesulfobacteriota bacterium]
GSDPHDEASVIRRSTFSISSSEVIYLVRFFSFFFIILHHVPLNINDSYRFERYPLTLALSLPIGERETKRKDEIAALRSQRQIKTEFPIYFGLCCKCGG